MKETRFKQTEIGAIPKDWEVKTLGEIGNIIGGGTPSTTKTEYWNGNIQWFTPAEITKAPKYVSKSKRTITPEGLKASSATVLPEGTLLITSRASIGFTSILQVKATTNQGFQSLIVNNENSNEFIYYKLDSLRNELIKNASGSTFPEISGKKLGLIKTGVPLFPEQQRIAQVLSDTDSLITSIEKLIAKKEAIKQGAMQQLLTGKTRLSGFAKSKGFKQTEIGSIPEDWEVKKIKDIAPLQRGFDLPSSEIQGGRIPVVYSNGICNFHNRGKCKAPGLVTGRSGTIGKFTYISQGDYWPHNTTLWVTSFKGNDPLFIYYLYCSIKIEDFSGGSGVPTLNRNNVHEKMVALPSLSEQQHIAQILSDMDTETAALHKKLDKYRALKQGMMQQLLTGKIRLNNR